MERSLPQRHLHRDDARSLASSCRRHSHRGRQLPGPRKRAGNRRAQEEEVKAASEAETIYVAVVLTQYTDLSDTPLRPSLTDQALARKLHSEAVPLSLVESALLLAALRRQARSSDLPPLPK